jgi:pimeloyl-ACP methyl ester carboxylesterase
MHNMKAFVLLFLLMAVASPVSAKPAQTGFYASSIADASRDPGSLIRYEPIRMPAFYRAKGWRILYATRDYRGRPIMSSGLVILPDSAARKPPGVRSIVAWAHPTTGVARGCAPSLASSPSSTILGINELVASGHIVAATDYPGLGTIGPIGYLVGKGQAYATLDSIRAAKQIPEVGGGNRVVLWGYSQGAHAALFASSLAARYAPEFSLLGVAAVAPPTNLGMLLIADINSLDGRVLTSFTLGSWSLKYGLPLSALASPGVIAAIGKVNRKCVTKVSDLLDILSAQRPLEERFLDRNPLQVPGWSDALASNTINGIGAGVPAIVLQGDADDIVRPQVSLGFVRTSCRNGARVKYVVLRNKGHGSSAKAAVPDSMNWINARFRGDPAPSSCR